VSFPDALIFDMDGLLVDSEPIAAIAMERFLARRMVDTDPDIYVQLLGRRLPEAMTIVKKWYGLEGDHAELTDEYGELRLAAIKEGLPAMPGAFEIIAWARELGIPTALATSSMRSHADVGVAAAGITGLFTVEATGDEVEHGKPAPDLFLLAAERLGVAPARCLVFEDAPAGVQAGKAAGMEVVWIPNDHTRTVPMPVAPDWRAESLFEAMDVLESRRLANV
jgi:HAD superfamily hydrolase (TIGR01509 family)